MFLRNLNFCPDFFGYVGKRLDKRAKVNNKNYYVINWKTNNYNTHIAQYLKGMKFGQLMNYETRNIFLRKNMQNMRLEN